MTAYFKIEYRLSVHYYAEINRQMERTNQILFKILRKTVDDSERDWNLELSVALWIYRKTQKVTTYTTPFYFFVNESETILHIEFKIQTL